MTTPPTLSRQATTTTLTRQGGPPMLTRQATTSRMTTPVGSPMLTRQATTSRMTSPGLSRQATVMNKLGSGSSPAPLSRLKSFFEEQTHEEKQLAEAYQHRRSRRARSRSVIGLDDEEGQG